METKIFNIDFGTGASSNSNILLSGLSEVKDFLDTNRRTSVTINLNPITSGAVIPLDINSGLFQVSNGATVFNDQRFESIEVTSNGSTLEFYRDSSPMEGGFLNFSGFKNVYVHDLNTKMKSGHLCNFQGEVVSITPTTVEGRNFSIIEIEPDPEFHLIEETLLGLPGAIYKINSDRLLDENSDVIYYTELSDSSSNVLEVTINGSNNYVVTALSSGVSFIEVGSILAVKMFSRDYFWITAQFCDSFKSNNVTVYDFPGIIYSLNACGDVYLKDINILSEEERFFSCQVAFLRHIEAEHSVKGNYNVYIDNITIPNYAGDDFANINTYWFKVIERTENSVKIKRLIAFSELTDASSSNVKTKSEYFYSFDEQGKREHKVLGTTRRDQVVESIEIFTDNPSQVKDFVQFKTPGTSSVIVKNCAANSTARFFLESLCGSFNSLYENNSGSYGGPFYWCGSAQRFFPETGVKSGKTVIRNNRINKSNKSINKSQGIIDTYVDLDNETRLTWKFNDKDFVIENNTITDCGGYVADMSYVKSAIVRNNAVTGQEFNFVKVDTKTDIVNSIVSDLPVLMSDLPTNTRESNSVFPTERVIRSSLISYPSNRNSLIPDFYPEKIKTDIPEGNISSSINSSTNVSSVFTDCILDVIGWFQVSGIKNPQTNNYLPEYNSSGLPVSGPGWVSYEKPGASPGDIVLLYRLSTVGENINAIWDLLSPGALSYWTDTYSVKSHVSKTDIVSKLPHPGSHLSPFNPDGPDGHNDLIWKNVTSQYSLPGPGNSIYPQYIRELLPEFGIRMVVWTDSCCYALNNSVGIPSTPPVVPPPNPPSPPSPPTGPPPFGGPVITPGPGGGTPGTGGGGLLIPDRVGFVDTPLLPPISTDTGRSDIPVSGETPLWLNNTGHRRGDLSEVTVTGKAKATVQRVPISRTSSGAPVVGSDVVGNKDIRPGSGMPKIVERGKESFMTSKNNGMHNKLSLSEIDYQVKRRAYQPGNSYLNIREGQVQNHESYKEVSWVPSLSESTIRELGLSNYNVLQDSTSIVNRRISNPITPLVDVSSNIKSDFSGQIVEKTNTNKPVTTTENRGISQKSKVNFNSVKESKLSEGSLFSKDTSGLNRGSFLNRGKILNEIRDNSVKFANSNAGIIRSKGKPVIELKRTNETVTSKVIKDISKTFTVTPVFYGSGDGINLTTIINGNTTCPCDVILLQSAIVQSDSGRFIADLGNSGTIRFDAGTSESYMIGTNACLPGEGSLPDVIANGVTWSFMTIVSTLINLQGNVIAQNINTIYPSSMNDIDVVAPNKLPIGVMRDLEITNASSFLYDGIFNKRSVDQLEWYRSEPHFIFERTGSTSSSVSIVLKATVTSQSQGTPFRPVMEVYADTTLKSSGSLAAFIGGACGLNPGWVKADGSIRDIGSNHNMCVGSSGIEGAGGSSSYVINEVGNVVSGPYNPSVYGRTHHCYHYYKYDSSNPSGDSSLIAASTKYRLRVHSNGPTNEFNGYGIISSGIRIPAASSVIQVTDGKLYGSITTYHCNQILKVVNETTGEEVERRSNWDDGTISFSLSTPASALLSVSIGDKIKVFRPGFNGLYNINSLIYEFTVS